jgi:hypothetical protein
MDAVDIKLCKQKRWLSEEICGVHSIRALKDDFKECTSAFIKQFW